jgi:hypothetical protein
LVYKAFLKKKKKDLLSQQMTALAWAKVMT